MTVLAIFLGLLVVILGFICYKLMIRLDETETTLEDLNAALETALDELDEAHREISSCASQDVLDDDPVTRRVVRAVFKSRDKVLEVSKILAVFDKEPEA